MIGFIICDPFPYIPYHALEEPRNLWRTRPISFVVARPLSVHLAGIRSASEGPLRTVWSTWRKPMNGAVNRQAMAGQTQRNWDWLNSKKKGWNQENLLYLAAEGVEYFPEHALTFETMTKPFKLPRQGKSPFLCLMISYLYVIGLKMFKIPYNNQWIFVFLCFQYQVNDCALQRNGGEHRHSRARAPGVVGEAELRRCVVQVVETP